MSPAVCTFLVLFHLRPEPGRLLVAGSGGLFFAGQAIGDGLLQLSRRALEGASQVRFAVRQSPAHGSHTIIRTGQLEPGTIRISHDDVGNGALALADEDNERQLGSESLEQLRGVLELCSLTIALEVDWQTTKWHLALEVLVYRENHRR